MRYVLHTNIVLIVMSSDKFISFKWAEVSFGKFI